MLDETRKALARHLWRMRLIHNEPRPRTVPLPAGRPASSDAAKVRLRAVIGGAL